MRIADMHLAQLRNTDLNLLTVFAVMAEERNISRAAARLFLSQPALSRALRRLRETFHDDLLVRTPHGYEITLKGQALLDELSLVLPKLDRLVSGACFDPKKEKAVFRLAATDCACAVLSPPLCRLILPAVGDIAFEFGAWHEGTYDALERGRTDMSLQEEDEQVGKRFESTVLCEEEFVCAVARDSNFQRTLSLDAFLKAKHIAVQGSAGASTLVERLLTVEGARLQAAIRVPYFAAALRSVAGTDLVATIPRRLALVAPKGVKLLRPPAELRGFRYVMLWHSRLTPDAAHVWLRAAVLQAAQALVHNAGA